jgi:RimJ/RimL family protein N-acetyltransferase
MIITPQTTVLKNNIEVILKSPLPSDAEKLIMHLKNAFNESYRNMNQPKNHWDNFPIEEEIKILESFCASSDKFMISAFMGDRIIGNLGLFGMGTGFVSQNARIGMGLEKEFHNQGLGTALLNRAIIEARAAGFHRLELTVRTFNHSGITLYEKMNFKKVGILNETAFIDGEYFDEFMYELLLKNFTPL